VRTVTLFLVTALVAVAATTAQAAPAPHVVLRSADPVTVHGSGFHRRERVRVHVQASGVDVTRRVRAGRRGRFTTTFAGVGPMDRCTVLLVTATDASGLRARMRRPPQPGCAPA
jgi:hypothetical protein